MLGAGNKFRIHVVLTADVEAKTPRRLMMLDLRENQAGWLAWILVKQDNRESAAGSADCARHVGKSK